jgi:hypothetical protein
MRRHFLASAHLNAHLYLERGCTLRRQDVCNILFLFGSPSRTRTYDLAINSQKLGQARDLLLPQLMNGEIAV